MRRIVLTLCTFLVTGCTTARMNGDATLSPEEREGMIVLSTRYEDQCGGAMGSAALNLEILQDNKIVRRQLPVMNFLLKKDFNDPPGFFHAWKLPAGDLRFANVTRADMNSSGRSIHPIDFHMRIEPGKVYYLGELYVGVGCDGFRLRVKDERLRDAALFDQRMTVLKSTLFEYRLFQLH